MTYSVRKDATNDLIAETNRHLARYRIAYRNYLEHAENCSACDAGRCDIAVNLWMAFREARKTIAS